LQSFQEESRHSEVSRVASTAFFRLVQTAVLVFLVVVTASFAAVFAETIYLSYFKVPDEVEVPAISGKNIDDANEIMKHFKLKLAVQESRHTAKFAKDVVISQNPSAGRKVRQDREIEAVVSLGPELVDVPDLKGKSLREARMILSNSRLRLGKIVYKPEKGGNPEQILNQKPAGGDRVSKGQNINLEVQKGSGTAITEIPRWTGTHVYRIEDLMAARHLELGSISWVFNDFVPKGEVVSQFPPEGQKVAYRCPMDLEVSAGPTQPHLFKQRTLAIQVPGGSQSQRVSVVLNSDIGADKIFEGSSASGDMSLLVAGWTGSEVEVYVNDRLQKREKL
jgi:beta-lactam-binding protein with PASTA domain